ncbi:hypothetical protein KP509_05G083000 [Ceratopteris richardii]|uniref:Uncharacterized protein n=1 Tax=Ceratopteris richardii TaxID=49495 RepID=A0A8T2UV78_CERRI|nr:hypothetical protein KP509_05G083000 [Ceratopteris richardii]
MTLDTNNNDIRHQHESPHDLNQKHIQELQEKLLICERRERDQEAAIAYLMSKQRENEEWIKDLSSLAHKSWLNFSSLSTKMEALQDHIFFEFCRPLHVTKNKKWYAAKTRKCFNNPRNGSQYTDCVSRKPPCTRSPKLKKTKGVMQNETGCTALLRQTGNFHGY